MWRGKVKIRYGKDAKSRGLCRNPYVVARQGLNTVGSRASFDGVTIGAALGWRAALVCWAGLLAWLECSIDRRQYSSSLGEAVAYAPFFLLTSCPYTRGSDK